MLTAIAVTLYVALIAVLVLESRKKEAEQILVSRLSALGAGAQIVCGDCAGNGDQPRITRLTQTGVCETCGGTSYIFASDWAMMRILVKVRRARVQEMPHTAARVLPFDRQTALDTIGSKKLAV